MSKLSFAVKRKILQIIAFGFTNAKLQNFATGRLYQGKWKEFCAPGLNCYSCPAAVVSCPIGALQNVLGDRKFSMSFYVVGLLLAFGVVLGRGVCGFLCPFGLFQEILHRVPLPKRRLPKPLIYVKYAVLAVFVVALPLIGSSVAGVGKPAFCEFICPAGTLEGGIAAVVTNPLIRKALGFLFSWKMSILIAVVLLSMIYYRFFCRVLCPLGAIYGFFNRISFLQLDVDHSRCTHCGACSKVCKMDVVPCDHPDSAECIRCGACAEICPEKALRLHFAGRKTVEKAVEAKG